MTLEIVHLKLKINTPKGLFGVEIPFSKGLFILHANNTSGKSTCLQSIIYALGLEGMLGPSQDIPMPPVVTDFLDFEGEVYNVLESEVLLEISNGRKVVTVCRQIKGSRNKHLVTVWDGPILSQSNTNCISSDYIVREPGGASRERGFHYFLANFIEWKLPTVPTFEEGEVLLYMETIFPLIFVEQKHGWSNLRNRFPTYFRIKDVSRRVFEFLFDLDAQEIASRKIFLKQQAAELKTQWALKIDLCNRLSRSIDATISGLPTQPVSIWPPNVFPHILMPSGDDWINSRSYILELEEDLRGLENIDIPNTEEVSNAAQEELQSKQLILADIEVQLKLKFEELENQIAYIESLRSRITSLREELSRNRDLRRLIELGSTQELQSSGGVCPTCEQSISDSLISPQPSSEIMTVEQNIDFIREQLKIFEAMLDSESSNIDLKRRKVSAIGNFASELRQDIRSLKTTLTSESKAPSYATIERRIRISEKIRQTKVVIDQTDQVLGEFSDLAEQWQLVQAELSALPKGILSDEDVSKIRSLERKFRDQLREYEFRSLNADDISISQNTYFPEYDGFDLQFDASASDYIRIVWAYLLGLLEVSREHHTNHLGLLILDEPRQQSAGESSIQAFLARASAARQHGQQVIVATSESEPLLEGILENIPYSYGYKRFDNRLIAPL
ncbi:AAA family ATPase [Phormidium tenue]|uniref:Nuclease SbcCD subunit C n=1 Tax=Phormidium tenue NIES-30 TaxID=549789 RepID=A0A1U7IZL4_9CYAN|nr:AAA family ATPase [Phormidium tenue]MBD2234403.1 AAA family ATPase [Phormidium tenue FACHB-1052]OKH44514.1 hypothetical protein NIES30_22085 [Phormidium tenue NIES-30]